MFTDIGDTFGLGFWCLSRRCHDVDDAQLRADPGALDVVPPRGAARGAMGLLEVGDLAQDLLQPYLTERVIDKST